MLVVQEIERGCPYGRPLLDTRMVLERPLRKHVLFGFLSLKLPPESFYSGSVIDKIEAVHVHDDQGYVEEQIQTIADFQDISLNIPVGHEIHGIFLGFQHIDLEQPIRKTSIHSADWSAFKIGSMGYKMAISPLKTPRWNM